MIHMPTPRVQAVLRSLSVRAGVPVSARRAFPLEDISIRADGTGRTVEAYAAVFNQEETVSDFEGRGYVEVIRRGTFDRSIAQRLSRLQVIYNHGLDIYGNPAAEYAKPLGVPLEVREEARGLWTVTRYSRTPLADEILELIRDGAIRAQSVGGKWVRSSPDRGPYRPGQRVERFEMALNEYGPTPFPVYDGAEVVGVRSVADIAEQVTALSADERAELVSILSGTPLVPADPGTDDPAAPPPDPDPEPQPAATTPADDPEAELELLRAIHLATSPKGTS